MFIGYLTEDQFLGYDFFFFIFINMKYNYFFIIKFCNQIFLNTSILIILKDIKSAQRDSNFSLLSYKLGTGPLILLLTRIFLFYVIFINLHIKD